MNEFAPFAVLLGLIILVIVLMAALEVFAISKTLKAILAELRGTRPRGAAAPPDAMPSAGVGRMLG